MAWYAGATMRTTFKVDYDLLACPRALAAERGGSVGAALFELSRRRLRARLVDVERRFAGFAAHPDSPPITPEMVRDANEDW